jgi:hypothetical protein
VSAEGAPGAHALNGAAIADTQEGRRVHGNDRATLAATPDATLEACRHRTSWAVSCEPAGRGCGQGISACPRGPVPGGRQDCGAKRSPRSLGCPSTTTSGSSRAGNPTPAASGAQPSTKNSRTCKRGCRPSRPPRNDKALSPRAQRHKPTHTKDWATSPQSKAIPPRPNPTGRQRSTCTSRWSGPRLSAYGPSSPAQRRLRAVSGQSSEFQRLMPTAQRYTVLWATGEPGPRITPVYTV